MRLKYCFFVHIYVQLSTTEMFKDSISLSLNTENQFIWKAKQNPCFPKLLELIQRLVTDTIKLL